LAPEAPDCFGISVNTELRRVRRRHPALSAAPAAPPTRKVRIVTCGEHIAAARAIYVEASLQTTGPLRRSTLPPRLCRGVGCSIWRMHRRPETFDGFMIVYWRGGTGSRSSRRLDRAFRRGTAAGSGKRSRQLHRVIRTAWALRMYRSLRTWETSLMTSQACCSLLMKLCVGEMRVAACVESTPDAVVRAQARDTRPRLRPLGSRFTPGRVPWIRKAISKSAPTVCAPPSTRAACSPARVRSRRSPWSWACARSNECRLSSRCARRVRAGLARSDLEPSPQRPW
jgi:hypothetical protein